MGITQTSLVLGSLVLVLGRALVLGLCLVIGPWRTLSHEP